MNPLILLQQLDAWLCAREEENARRHGWEITRLGFGKRHYRDPLLNELPQRTDHR